MVTSSVFVVFAWLPVFVYGHGRLIDPPSRSTMWRYGFNSPPNYDDNQLYCGGVQVQYEINGGKCGVCGDPWSGPRHNEPPGKYANGMIVRKYSVGQIMTVMVELTANHKGWMEFKLCPNDDPRKAVTQSCLDRYPLHIVETNTKRYTVPHKNGYTKIKLSLRLPPGVTCKDCVLQWKYNAGNSWGTDPISGRGCIGCGNQEQFYGCADIAIGHDDIKISPHRTLPADMEDDEEKDATMPPIIPRWRPRTPEPEMDIDKEWEMAAERQLQEEKKKRVQSFSFMPVMNSGMNPCMCVCKRSPLKMHGGAKNALEVQFFEGMDGIDNQVCMCMCQSSSAGLHISVLTYICAVVLSFTFILTNRRRLV